MRLKWWQRILVTAVTFLALAGLFSGFHVQSLGVALGASIVLGILNLFIKPLLVLFSLPITLITFGLFSVVINAIILSLTSGLVGAGFSFSSFGVTLLVAISMSIVNSLLNSWVMDRR